MIVEEVKAFIEDAKNGKTLSQKRMNQIWEMVFNVKYKFTYCLSCLKRDIQKLEDEIKNYELADTIVESHIILANPVKKIRKKKNE